jgi:hypothetical protein
MVFSKETFGPEAISLRPMILVEVQRTVGGRHDRIRRYHVAVEHNRILHCTPPELGGNRVHAKILYESQMLAHGSKHVSVVVQSPELLTLDASLQILISRVGAYTDAVDQVIADTQLW